MRYRALGFSSVKSPEFSANISVVKPCISLLYVAETIRTEERYFPRALQSPISIGPFHTFSSHNPVCYLTKLDIEVILKTSRREYTFLNLLKE